jgi:thiol-disulfide isomerase/thioredoxin
MNLSKKPLKSKIAFALGKDKKGETKMVVDVNNNLDLSDDPIFTPKEIMDNNKARLDSFRKENSITVSYELVSGNKIIEAKTSLLVVHLKEYNRLMYCFPQYATAHLNGIEIAISSDNFRSPSYTKTGLVLTGDSVRNSEIKGDKIISEGEYITIEGQLYLNKGVNVSKNVLVLERSNLPQNQLHSMQVGFKPFPFEGQKFKTSSVLSLDSFKGKYLLLDFWAIWCTPCLREFPSLKALYDNADKSKFEMIGIAGDSPPELIERMIKDFSLTWPQIMSDEKNKIKEKYGITDYPRSLLINPEGIIVAKDLKGKDLENKIREILK